MQELRYLRVAGKYGSAVYLDGVDDYIESANIVTEAGTIEFWFKPDWDGGGLAFMYLNGEEAATSPRILGGFPPLDVNMRFGLKGVQYVASKNGATGAMDEIAIYNRALTAEEITKDMAELFLPVEPLDKITATWGYIKNTYLP